MVEPALIEEGETDFVRPSVVVGAKGQSSVPLLKLLESVLVANQ